LHPDLVLELNRSPVLHGIANRFATLLSPVVIINHAQDADVPANSLTFSLGAGALTGALFNGDWHPPSAQSRGATFEFRLKPPPSTDMRKKYGTHHVAFRQPPRRG
jgi:hypothetical protein